MVTRNELQDEIVELETKLKQAKRQLILLNTDSSLTNLASKLHTLLCGYNHIDGCGWFYEFHNGEEDWGGYTHSDYLNIAKKVAEKVSADEAVKVIDAIQKGRI